jgi:hypothetical protein
VKEHRITKPLLALLASGAIATVAGYAQTGSTQTSNYLFRFNTGISSVFLSDMTFPTQKPLNLGACTVTEKINGPLACVVNCDQESVCLLDLSGPSGATVNDVLQIVSETPVPAASGTPSPTASNIPPSTFGSTIRDATDSASLTKKRIDAYNGAR